MKAKLKKGTPSTQAVEAPKTEKTYRKGPKSEKTKVEAEVDTANAASVAKKITKEKDLMYIYPKDADNLPSRKKFRSKVRAEVRKLEKKIKKLETLNLPEDTEQLEKLYKEQEKLYKRVYTKEYIGKLYQK